MSGHDHLGAAAALLASTDEKGNWCVPWNAGLASEPQAVGKLLGQLLTVLGEVNSNVIHGELVDQLWALRVTLHDQLTAVGWRIRAKEGHGWKVLPPLEPKKKTVR